jgi:hypothetical protein
MSEKCWRWDIINRLIKEMGYKSYLEIGVRRGACLNRIEAETKVGVDPRSPVEGVKKMTSDVFFEQNDETFDVIFVDGDHRWPQAVRDVLESLEILNPGGVILMHDCMALEEKHATGEHTTGLWNGTVWYGFSMLRMTRPDLEMWTIAEDHGVGIVRPGTQEPYCMHNAMELTHGYYRQFMKEILNLVEFEDFFSKTVPEWKATLDV